MRICAEDARKLTDAARSLDGEKVKIVLDCWHHAIEKAAREGRHSIREDEVARVRTPIPSAAREAAFDQLRATGFAVKTVDSGRNETTTEVSW